MPVFPVPSTNVTAITRSRLIHLPGGKYSLIRIISCGTDQQGWREKEERWSFYGTYCLLFFMGRLFCVMQRQSAFHWGCSILFHCFFSFYRLLSSGDWVISQVRKSENPFDQVKKTGIAPLNRAIPEMFLKNCPGCYASRLSLAITLTPEPSTFSQITSPRLTGSSAFMV